MTGKQVWIQNATWVFFQSTSVSPWTPFDNMPNIWNRWCALSVCSKVTTSVCNVSNQTISWNNLFTCMLYMLKVGVMITFMMTWLYTYVIHTWSILMKITMAIMNDNRDEHFLENLRQKTCILSLRAMKRSPAFQWWIVTIIPCRFPCCDCLYFRFLDLSWNTNTNARS